MDAVAVLETFPEIGSLVEDVPFTGLRERLIGPYRVVYCVNGIECLILADACAEQDLRRIITPEDLP